MFYIIRHYCFVFLSHCFQGQLQLDSSTYLFYSSFTVFQMLQQTYFYNLKIVMKFRGDQHQSDLSTKERERRFHRRTKRDLSKSFSSKSSRHQQSPLPRFYVKDALKRSTTQQVDCLLNGNLNSGQGPHKNKQIGEVMKTQPLDFPTNEQDPESESKFESRFLKQQIAKCYEYIRKIKSAEQDNKKLKIEHAGEIRELQQKLEQQLQLNKKLTEQNANLKSKLAQKQSDLQKHKTKKKNEKDSLNLKTSILKARVEEYEEQVRVLKGENDKLRSLMNDSDDGVRKQDRPDNIQQRYLQNKNLYTVNKLLSIKFELENEIKHINIKNNTELFSLKKEMKLLREAKQKEYNVLKDKFLSYLQKYKAKQEEKEEVCPPWREEQEDNNSLNFSMSEDNENY